MSALTGSWRDRLRLLDLSAKMLAGRRYWIAPLLPLLWIGFQIFRLLVQWRPENFNPSEAQNVLIGFPLIVLAVGLGVRVVAGDIDRRTLEIAYTVPGGTHRVWIAKLVAAMGILLLSLTMLAVITYVFCTDYPIGALYGALQASTFYLMLAMAMAALFKSEATGALVTVAVLILNFFVQAGNVRLSPFWNPENFNSTDAATLMAWTVQNRIGFLLATAVVIALAFARAEQREKILSG